LFSDTGGVADAAPLHARKNFDTVFLTLSDVVYRDGSIHHAVSGHDYFWLAVGQMMTGIPLHGLVVRQKDGRASVSKAHPTSRSMPPRSQCSFRVRAFPMRMGGPDEVGGLQPRRVKCHDAVVTSRNEVNKYCDLSHRSSNKRGSTESSSVEKIGIFRCDRTTDKR
jgi:hypothetical protein